MSRTRGHKNCSRRNCWCCTRQLINKFKEQQKAPTEQEYEGHFDEMDYMDWFYDEGDDYLD